MTRIIIIFLLCFIPFVLFKFYFSEPTSVLRDDPAIVVSDFLKRIPLERKFYVVLSLLVIARLYWHLWRIYSIRDDFKIYAKTDIKTDLTGRDWLVVQGLRERALFLRTRADFILGSAFVLLFAGIYLFLYMLPLVIETSDLELANLARQNRTFMDSYSDRLDKIVDGLYWLKIPEDSTLREKINKVQHKTASKFGAKSDIEWSISLTEDYGENWEQIQLPLKEIYVVSLSEVKTGLLADYQGFVKITNDMNFWSPLELPLKPGEIVRDAEFSLDGNIGTIVGTTGSVFMTKKKGEEWIQKEDLDLKDRESVATLTFSKDRKTIVVIGNYGTVLMTTNRGASWEKQKIDLQDRQRLSLAAISENGDTGIVVGDLNSVFMTTNGGTDWNEQSLKLKERERVTTAAVSANGKTGLIAGNKGSAYMYISNENDWESLDLGLENVNWNRRSVLNSEGTTGLLVNSSGSVYRIIKNGEEWNWNKQKIELNFGESITSAFNSDGKIGMIAGNQGSTFITSNYGQKWDKINLNLKDREWIDWPSFSVNGKFGMVRHKQNSIYITEEFGEKEKRAEMLESLLEYGERLEFAKFSSNGTIGMITSNLSFVYLKTSDRNRWEKIDLPLDEGERAVEAALSKDEKKSVIVGDKGSIITPTDGWKFFNKQRLPLETRESVVDAEFSKEFDYGIIVGNHDSIFVTKDGGQNWDLTQAPSKESFYRIHYLADLDGNLIVSAIDGEYILKNFPNLDGWRNWSFAKLAKEMSNDEILRFSQFFKEIKTFVENTTATSGEHIDDNGEMIGDDGEVLTIFDDIFNILTLTRVAILAVLFFLVQILVRLYQYTLRLSAFVDARADAVLLAQSFSENKAERFDNLVEALSPDALDFKHGPRIPLDWSWTRRDH